jgi:hypothetical protein
LTGTYRLSGDQYVEAEGGAASPPNASEEQRRREAHGAETWFTDLTHEVYA